MATYRWDKSLSKFVDKKTGEPMHQPERNELCAPMIISDLPAYFSVASGKWVDGRRDRREDLARTGCVPYEPTKTAPKGIGNPRYAAKHGLKLSEEAANRPRAKRIDPLAELKA